MNNLIVEASNYIDQLIHINPDTKNRISSVIKEYVEILGDDTSSYYEYHCMDKEDQLVISFTVNINDYVELIDEVECY